MFSIGRADYSVVYFFPFLLQHIVIHLGYSSVLHHCSSKGNVKHWPDMVHILHEFPEIKIERFQVFRICGEGACDGSYMFYPFAMKPCIEKERDIYVQMLHVPSC